MIQIGKDSLRHGHSPCEERKRPEVQLLAQEVLKMTSATDCTLLVAQTDWMAAICPKTRCDESSAQITLCLFELSLRLSSKHASTLALLQSFAMLPVLIRLLL